MLAKTKLLLSSLLPLSMDFCNDFFSEEIEKLVNNGLTNKEIEDGYIIDSVLGKCNMRKALKERDEAIRREYETFNTMHRNNGTFSKSGFRL